jgi:hypothetical protein
MIKRVRRKFLRHVAYRLNISCPPHDYTPIQRLLSLESLADRRHSVNIAFLSNLLSSKIDSHESLPRVSINIPCRRTRSSVPFRIPLSSSNYYDTLLTDHLSLCTLPTLTLHSPSKIEPRLLRAYTIIFYHCILFILVL